VKQGANRNGKTIHCYMNYSGHAQTFKYPYRLGEDLLTKTSVAASQKTHSAPWEFAIVEEK
jgi:beta-galactosidase